MSHSINNNEDYDDEDENHQYSPNDIPLKESYDSIKRGGGGGDSIIASPTTSISSHGGTSPLIKDSDRHHISDDDDDDEVEQIQDEIYEGESSSSNNYKRKIKNKKDKVQQSLKEGLTKVRSLNASDLKVDTSKYLKSIIYGGMDGLISIFVSVAVVASGDAPVSVLLVIAVAKLVAGAISMGMGDYLGTQADVDFAKGERQRETWEVDYYIEGEKQEMVDIYCEKGIPVEVATEVVDILATNPKGFVDVMMVEELGITPDAESEVAWKNGMVNFVSFLIFGIIPIIPYLLYLAIASVRHSGYRDNLPTFLSVIGVAIITLFGMGIFKAKSTQTSLFKNGVSTVFFGCIGAAAGIATVEIIKLINPDIDING